MVRPRYFPECSVANAAGIGAPGSQNGSVFSRSLTTPQPLCADRHRDTGLTTLAVAGACTCITRCACASRLTDWNSEWHSNPENVERTRAVLKKFAIMYKDRTDVVTGIEALNECVSVTKAL